MSSSTEDRIPVGRVGRPHGVRGHVIVRPLTDNPERFRPGARFLTASEPPRELLVVSHRPHQHGFVLRFDGVADRDAAAELGGATLTIAVSERRDLGEDEYWPDQLEGMAALAPDGSKLGMVSGVVLAEAQDRLIVTTLDGSEIEVPFVDELVGEVHPSGGFVILDLPEGFL